MVDARKSEVIEKLNLTRGNLFAFLAGLDEAAWETAVQSEDAQWTIADLVRHLMNAESGMTGLIEQFKAGKDPVPPDFDRERYNQSRVKKTQALTPQELMAQMSANREHLLTVIESLEDGDWSKKGRHASLRIMTIEEVCHLIADHESVHLEEMKKAKSP